MKKAGYRPATIWDLTGLHRKVPDLQKSFRIVGLGSRLNMSKFYAFPVLENQCKECRIDSAKLQPLGLWHKSFRFLACEI